MAMLKFKKGLYANLPAVSASSVGTVYVTTDEKAMYVDVSATERIRLGQIITYASKDHFVKYLENVAPPYDTQAFYYVADVNALLKWDGTNNKWIQINSTAAVTEAVEKAQAAANVAQAAANAAKDAADAAQKDATQAIADAKAANDNANTRVLTTDFDSFKTTNSAAIAEAKKAGTDAASAASAAQSTADSAVAKAEAAQVTADKKADKKHASESTDYGVGNSTLYGHVKLSDAVNSTSGVSDGIAATPAAVKSAKDAADAAKQAADNNAATITAQGTRIDDLENAIGSGGSIGTDVANLKDIVGDASKGLVKEVADLQTAVGDSTSGLIKDVADLKAKDTALEESINNLTATVTANATTAANATKAVDDKLGTGFSSTNTVAKAISDAKTEATNANNSLKTELTADINKKADQSDLDDLTTEVGTKASTAALDQAKSDLQDELKAHIKAANAMKYMGTVDMVSDLPTSDVSIGDTYVATGDMTVGGQTVYTGDLLIANGTENDDNIITSGLTWQVVGTGYSSTKDPKLVIKDNAIELQNAANGSLGKVAIAGSDDSNIVVSYDSANSKITVGMTWGEF